MLLCWLLKMKHFIVYLPLTDRMIRSPALVFRTFRMDSTVNCHFALVVDMAEVAISLECYTMLKNVFDEVLRSIYFLA